MPSDDRVTLARAALARPIAEFRTEVEGALDQAYAFLAGHAAGDDLRAARAGAELGEFARGRIEPGRFAALFPPTGGGDPDSIAAVERAVEVLREVAVRGDDLFLTEVTDDRPLGATIDAALRAAGRAFGAIVLAELVRAGAYRPATHNRLLDPAGFDAWNRVERRFAPPLVVQLEGAQLHAGALTEFADGRAKLVLVVRGPAAPAPLARCITPGTLVVQTVDGSGLEEVAAFDGPAIVALMPAGSAAFSHDPRRGAEGWQRLTVDAMPEAPSHALGGTSAWQMAEDLRLLADLGRAPFTVPDTGVRSGQPMLGSDQAIDRVAEWLLGQAGLQDGA